MVISAGVPDQPRNTDRGDGADGGPSAQATGLPDATHDLGKAHASGGGRMPLRYSTQPESVVSFG